MKNIFASGGNLLTSSVKEMYEAKKDFDKVKENEITKRNDSNNRTQENIEAINAQKEVIIKQLDNSFEINKAKLCKTFDVIDNALETNNIQMLSVGLNAMNSVSENSRLINLNDAKLLDKNEIIDI